MLTIDATLGQVASGQNLSAEQMAETIDAIMRGQWTDPQIGLLLTALRAKGETSDEVAGAALALRRHMTPIRSRRANLLDTCGTGGDGSNTFNISTAAALVAAAAGAPVAKHGNRAITSRSGSGDVLAALGVNVLADLPTVERALDELGLCFCFAPLFHGAMKRVSAVRKQLGVPTIFNLLGPLANPAGAPFQVIGVARPELRGLVAEALVRLGARRAIVVHGHDGLDELTLTGPTFVSEATGQGVRDFAWSPEDFGFARSRSTRFASRVRSKARRSFAECLPASVARLAISWRSTPRRDFGWPAAWRSRETALPRRSRRSIAALPDNCSPRWCRP